MSGLTWRLTRSVFVRLNKAREREEKAPFSCPSPPLSLREKNLSFLKAPPPPPRSTTSTAAAAAFSAIAGSEGSIRWRWRRRQRMSRPHWTSFLLSPPSFDVGWLCLREEGNKRGRKEGRKEGRHVVVACSLARTGRLCWGSSRGYLYLWQWQWQRRRRQQEQYLLHCLPLSLTLSLSLARSLAYT